MSEGEILLSNPPALSIWFTLRLEPRPWDSRSKSCLSGRRLMGATARTVTLWILPSSLLPWNRGGGESTLTFPLCLQAMPFSLKMVCANITNCALPTSKGCPLSLTAHILPLQLRTTAVSSPRPVHKDGGAHCLSSLCHLVLPGWSKTRGDI